MKSKEISYYHVKTVPYDPLMAQYDGLYTFGGDWLENLLDLIAADVDAYVYDILKWHSEEKFEIQITNVNVSELPEDVKESLDKVPYEATHVIKVVKKDSRGASEIYIFISKN